MILVFFISLIFIAILVILVLTIFSHIQIEIDNLKISNLKDIKNSKKYIINNNYKINISLKFINKIKWVTVKLNKLKVNKMYKKMHLENIDIQKIEKNISVYDMKEILKIKPEIKKLKLHINIGLENVILTSYLVVVICVILSVILSKSVRKENIDKISYIVDPIYNNGNKYYIELESILNFKIFDVLKASIKIYLDLKEKNKLGKLNQNRKTKSETIKSKINCNV